MSFRLNSRSEKMINNKSLIRYRLSYLISDTRRDTILRQMRTKLILNKSGSHLSSDLKMEIHWRKCKPTKSMRSALTAG